MNASNETMLIAGEDGGKSTFAGALIHYLNRSDNDRNGRYTFEYGDATEFQDKIIDRMDNYNYPKQTDKPYLIQIKFDVNQDWNPETKIDLMDIPGEEQEQSIDDIKDGNWNPSDVHERYLEGTNNKSSVKDLIENNRNLSGNEWRTAYLYRYKRSTQVICLVNLHKRINEGRDLTVTPETIEKAANEKRKVALVITATDTMNFVPDQSKSFLEQLDFSVTPTETDDDLYEYIDQNLNATYNDLKQVINEGKDNDRVDMFGVSVPEDGNGQLKIDSNGFETHGFDRVISWLK